MCSWTQCVNIPRWASPIVANPPRRPWLMFWDWVCLGHASNYMRSEVFILFDGGIRSSEERQNVDGRWKRKVMLSGTYFGRHPQEYLNSRFTFLQSLLTAMDDPMYLFSKTILSIYFFLEMCSSLIYRLMLVPSGQHLSAVTHCIKIKWTQMNGWTRTVFDFHFNDR
jgi:hypothetical protein